MRCLICPIRLAIAGSTTPLTLRVQVYFKNPKFKTFNISGVEIFVFPERSSGAIIQFIDKYNNIIATGNFDTITNNPDDIRRIFVAKYYPQIQAIPYTIIKQVVYDAV